MAWGANHRQCSPAFGRALGIHSLLPAEMHGFVSAWNAANERHGPPHPALRSAAPDYLGWLSLLKTGHPEAKTTPKPLTT
jgi:hypothetical protein